MTPQPNLLNEKSPNNMTFEFDHAAIGFGATLLGVLGRWVWDIDRRVTAHEVIISKLDKLTDVLLQKELAKHD